jgi:hypothetical protein
MLIRNSCSLRSFHTGNRVEVRKDLRRDRPANLRPVLSDEMSQKAFILLAIGLSRAQALDSGWTRSTA